jgi:hypothetical protein
LDATRKFNSNPHTITNRPPAQHVARPVAGQSRLRFLGLLLARILPDFANHNLHLLAGATSAGLFLPAWSDLSMTHQPDGSDGKRGRRPETTYSKHVRLTEFGREKIEAWAQANGINFSAAIETLALMGLQDERSSFIVPALRATALQGIRLSFNRLARLLSDIAIEAAVSRTMSEGIMLQLIRELAVAHPDDFEAVMRVRRDGRSQGDARIRQFHDDLKARVEQEAVRRLKRSMSRVDELLNSDEEAIA